MLRRAYAVWNGGLKNGSGTLTTESKVLSEVPYSFGTRFENDPGTNPEELVAAAHAACFSMALSADLEKMGASSKSVSTSAVLTLEKDGSGWKISEIHLDVSADVSTISQEKFVMLAETAKTNCPISKLVKARVTMNAALKQKAA
ncbi:OsmC family protein [Bdellovibrionota bacterium FG-2]